MEINYKEFKNILIQSKSRPINLSLSDCIMNQNSALLFPLIMAELHLEGLVSTAPKRPFFFLTTDIFIDESRHIAGRSPE